MKRNQDQVRKNGSTTPTSPQANATASAHGTRPPQHLCSPGRRAVVDYEEVVMQAIGFIDLLISRFIPITEDRTISQDERIKDTSVVGCMQLAEYVKTRLYTGYYHISDDTPNAEQGRAAE